MIKLGIVGFGHQTFKVHLPTLLARNDISISWIVDPKIESLNVFKKNKIKLFKNIQDVPKENFPEITLIAIPYGYRNQIFEFLKGKTQGIYCEKPLAKNLAEHKNITGDYADYAFATGLTRRCLASVQLVKNVIRKNIFGRIKEIAFEFGSLHYSFTGFRSQFEAAGGGIVLEAGIHWFDTILYITNAEKILNFKVETKFVDKLDVYSKGSFFIVNKENDHIKCKYKITAVENTQDKMKFIFENSILELDIFSNYSKPILLINGNNKKIFLEELEKNKPNSSFDTNIVHWDLFLNSFKNKEVSYVNAKTCEITSALMGLIYGSN